MPGPHDTFAGYGPAWACVSNTPLRGVKATAWEGGIRSPLLVRWPEVVHSVNRLTNQPGHVIDIMATFLDLANTDYPVQFDARTPLPLEGKRLLPVLQGQERQPHEELCWSVHRTCAIRRGRWKAVRPRGTDSWQLFDLEADGTETTDLAEQHPALSRDMAARFEVWRQRVNTK